MAVAPDASLAEETLEEQVVFDWVDGDDAEHVADDAVDGEPAAGGVERRVQTKAGEHSGGGALRGHGINDSASGEQRQPVGGCEIDEEFDFALLAADTVALQFDVKPIGAEDGGELLEGGLRGIAARGAPRVADRAVFIAGERDEAFGVTGEFLPRREARALAVEGSSAGFQVRHVAAASSRRVFKFTGWKPVPLQTAGSFRELRLGDELAEILIAGARGGKERHDGAIRHRDFCAHARAEVVILRRAVEPRCAIHAVAIEQSQCRQFDLDRAPHEVFGIGGAAEKAESAARVKLDVAHAG